MYIFAFYGLALILDGLGCLMGSCFTYIYMTDAKASQIYTWQYMIHVRASQDSTWSMLYDMTCHEPEVWFGLGLRPPLPLALVLAPALAFGLVQIHLWHESLHQWASIYCMNDYMLRAIYAMWPWTAPSPGAGWQSHPPYVCCMYVCMYVCMHACIYM